jgi:hypothetical protein
MGSDNAAKSTRFTDNFYGANNAEFENSFPARYCETTISKQKTTTR